jgi:hypothetical protein
MSDRILGWVGLCLLLGACLLLAAVSVDARRLRAQRRAEQPAIDAVARRLPAPDLALSGGARWLRSPSLEEPGAAFAEGPAMPDEDPAGGVMAPPSAVWSLELDRRR